MVSERVQTKAAGGHEIDGQGLMAVHCTATSPMDLSDSLVLVLLISPCHETPTSAFSAALSAVQQA
jgi:hypothetical protein